MNKVVKGLAKIEFFYILRYGNGLRNEKERELLTLFLSWSIC